MAPSPANQHPCVNSSTRIAILGGGVAGSTIALRLAELGIDVTLIEQGPSLVNGPPICHLHAGGSFYREISDAQCLALLSQSIDTARVYPQCINLRPTVIALPRSDSGSPQDLLPRLQMLQSAYRDLVAEDPANKALGEPEDYFQLFERQQLEQLAAQALPDTPRSGDDWLVPVAKQLDLDKLQFPLLLVQEYGLSGFRFAATATLACQRLPSCRVLTGHRVETIGRQDERWQLQMSSEQGEQSLDCDYLINACGFRSGEIDDMLAAPRDRLVEFKAAYVTRWPQCQGHWPEVVFYGQRGTPEGMAQLTPYADGVFQLHGMTEDITLFQDGLAASSELSAQPQLPERFIKKIDCSWPAHTAEQRTLGSIAHMAQYIPAFSDAETTAKPLFGAQQIPGSDPSLRAADVSFFGERYARTEIVKASSALTAADEILQQLATLDMLPESLEHGLLREHYFPITRQLAETEVSAVAIKIAAERGYPVELAMPYPSSYQQTKSS